MRYALGGSEPQFHGDGHFVAPSADVIGNVELHDSVSVWYQAVVRGDQDRIVIGAGSNVQDAAVLHTDAGIELHVGQRVTIGHQAMLHGCVVGDESLIGIGATLLNGATIGRHCIVGAHALVTEGKSFDPGQLIVGAPARAVRELTAEEIQQLQLSAEHYVANAARFRSSAAPIDADSL
ncbi:MAG: gamma carbonic anhydrase family protein [Pseudomonadota bacterium]